MKTDEDQIEVYEDDIEVRARAQGWFPEDEWDEERAEREGRRKPPKFLSAAEFLERVDKNMPIQSERLKASERKLIEQEKQIKELGAIVREQQKDKIESVRRARAQGRAELEAELREAAANGDLDKLDEVTANIKKLEEEERKDLVAEAKASVDEPAIPDEPVVDEATKAWVDNNQWFIAKGNGHLNAGMIREHEKVVKEHPEMAPAEQLEKAKRALMRRYPEDFGAKESQGGSSLEGNSLNRRVNTGGSLESWFAALPKAERDTYERHKKTMANMRPPVDYTKAEFRAGYDGS